MELHKVFSVAETVTPGVFTLSVDLTDVNGERYVCDYVSSPNDTFGLAPDVRDALDEWLNSGKPVAPYNRVEVDPREHMPTLTPRQLRLQLIKSGFLLETIDQVLNNIPDKNQRAVAKIEWSYASEYRRNHPLIKQLAGTLSLSPETVDEMWKEAAKL